MIQLDMSDLPAFELALSLELARLDREITEKFRGWTVTLFKELVYGSPQWSGDLTANWRYSVNAPDFTYVPIPNKVEGSQFWSKADVYQRGAEPAVGMALANLAAAPKPTWRDTVYISNSTPIAADVEDRRVAIRPVNLVNGEVAMIEFVVAMEQRRGGFL